MGSVVCHGVFVVLALDWSDDESGAAVETGHVVHPSIAVYAADCTKGSGTWAVVCGLGVGSSTNHRSGTLGADFTVHDSTTEWPSLLSCWVSFDTDTDAELVCCSEAHDTAPVEPGVDWAVVAVTSDMHCAWYVTCDAGVVTSSLFGDTDVTVKLPLYTWVCDACYVSCESFESCWVNSGDE